MACNWTRPWLYSSLTLQHYMTAVLRTRACSCIYVVVGAKLCGRWYTWPASVWVCCMGRHSFVTGFLFDLCSLHNWVIECLTIAAGRMHENIVALCMAAPAYAISLLCIAQRAADCPLNSTCTLSLYHFRVGIKKLFPPFSWLSEIWWWIFGDSEKRSLRLSELERRYENSQVRGKKKFSVVHS